MYNDENTCGVLSGNDVGEGAKTETSRFEGSLGGAAVVCFHECNCSEFC